MATAQPAPNNDTHDSQITQEAEQSMDVDVSNDGEDDNSLFSERIDDGKEQNGTDQSIDETQLQHDTIVPTIEESSEPVLEDSVQPAPAGVPIPVAPEQQDEDSLFIPESLQKQDEDSLFIPETSPPRPPPTHQNLSPLVQTPEPARTLAAMSTTVPTVPPMSTPITAPVTAPVPAPVTAPANPTPTPAPAPSLAPAPALMPESKPQNPFARIRQMQQKLRASKSGGNKDNASSARPYRSTVAPDQEDFLETVLNRKIATVAGAQHKVAPDVIGNGDNGEEDQDREEAARFARLKNHYDELKRKNNGKLLFKHDIEWMRIQSAEDARQKKQKRALLKAKEERFGGDIGLFPGDDDANREQDKDEEDCDLESDFLAQGTARKRRKPDLPRKEAKRLSLRDAEYRSMKVAIEADDDLPKRKMKGAGGFEGEGAARGSGRPRKPKVKFSESSRANGAAKKSRGPRQTAKQKREKDRSIKQLGSLFSGNVFKEQAGKDAPDQPVFTSRNKAEALKELIASVPIEDQKRTRGDMGVLLSATKDFDGHGSARADGNGMWIIKGMKTSLKGYQLMGSAFMRRRENSTEEPKGGLMADQMGLGKTLMMLANIVNGRPPRGERKTTLLVASHNLLSQWTKEIQTHTDSNLKVMKYGAGNRLDSNCAFAVLEQHDIILTTYTEVMRSYPKSEPPITCQTAEEKREWWMKKYDEERGVLHRMQFYRVVLDEAQAIKNHTSRTSIACRALMADHRWALSGTPILNSLEELYPYFKFLNVPHTGSFKIFKQNYCDTSDPDNTERLLVRLAQFMIRRTHADYMFGAPILKLPNAGQAIQWCEFNRVERNVYDIVRQRFVTLINVWSSKGELEKSYSNALVMLLRLRQLTAHILMLQYVIRDLLEREDIERIREVVKESANDSSGAQTICMIREQLEDLAREEKMKFGKKGIQAQKDASPNNDEAGASLGDQEHDEVVEEETDTMAIGQGREQEQAGRGFGKEFNFKPYLNSLTTGESWKRVKEKSKCGGCGHSPKDPFLLSCHHLLCLQCYEEAIYQAAEKSDEHAICKQCGQTSRYSYQCEPDGEVDPDQYGGPETRSRADKGRGKARPRPGQEDIKEDWLSINGEGILPSAKTIAIKAQILNWFRENPKVKIIIYTQFLAMIRILAKVCEEEHWGCEQYHGKMSFGARDKAIACFADNPNTKILLASLRCGGLGLNLTMASRVIVIDPWWNSASEQQAFCRVFRIGQKDTTFMTRFCVRNTVDERLIQMQERKQKEIDSVMEDDGDKAKKMTLVELMRLFGSVAEDEKGKPFILVDNPRSHGGFRPDQDDEGYADEP